MYIKKVGYLSLVAAISLFAAPDAGIQTKEIEKGIETKEKELKQKELKKPEGLKPDMTDKGFKTLVKRFKIEGSTKYDDNYINKVVLKEFVDKELTYGDIKKAALTITNKYAEDGYVSKTIIPKQDVLNNEVLLKVIEGKTGEIFIEDANASNMSKDSLEGYLYHNQPKNEQLSLQNLQKGLYILNELPGFSAGSSLLPGNEDGFTDIVISAKDTQKIEASGYLDNFGNRYTGSHQTTAILNVNDISGMGRYDQLALRILATTGSKYGRIGYTMPVGYSGLKLGVNASKMAYKLGEDYKSDNITGESSTLGSSLDYPLIRSKNMTLSTSLSVEKKYYNDKNDNVDITRKGVFASTLGINGDTTDDWLGGGQNIFSLSYAKGELDITLQDQKDTDSTTARTDGSYHKLQITLSRTQLLDDTHSLFAQFSGQIAGKNMDSSEQLSLGGAYAVRAYPGGEASTDEGYVTNIELRRKLGGGFSANTFFDTGYAHINRSTWDGIGDIRNSYMLHGVGVGLNYAMDELSGKLFVAKGVGPNAGAGDNNKDSDGTKPSARVWLSLQYRF